MSMPTPFAVHSTPVVGTAAAAPLSRSGRSRVPRGWGAARAVSRSRASSDTPAVLPHRVHSSRPGGGSTPAVVPAAASSAGRARTDWSGTAASGGTPSCGSPASTHTIRATRSARRSAAPSTG